MRNETVERRVRMNRYVVLLYQLFQALLLGKRLYDEARSSGEDRTRSKMVDPTSIVINDVVAEEMHGDTLSSECPHQVQVTGHPKDRPPRQDNGVGTVFLDHPDSPSPTERIERVELIAAIGFG